MPRIFYVLLILFTAAGVIAYAYREKFQENYLAGSASVTTVVVYSPTPVATFTPSPTPAPTANTNTTPTPLATATPTAVPSPSAPLGETGGQDLSYYDNLPRSGPEADMGIALLVGGGGAYSIRYYLLKKKLKKSCRQIYIADNK